MVKKLKVNKLLKKPTAKLPTYSAKKIILKMGSESGPLVSETDPIRERYQNPEIDNRSLFFKEEYKRERQKSFGGFL